MQCLPVRPHFFNCIIHNLDLSIQGAIIDFDRPRNDLDNVDKPGTPARALFGALPIKFGGDRNRYAAHLDDGTIRLGPIGDGFGDSKYCTSNELSRILSERSRRPTSLICLHVCSIIRKTLHD